MAFYFLNGGELAQYDREIRLWCQGSAGLYLKDFQSGKEGITLGGILIFGTEEHAALPHYRTDAILRRVNLEL